ncbi:cephalosporin hydroxylase family protein [Variovorax sp. J22P271]|uniref:cephalosporin hydroxylase family protein n=1 Tax=Variovorax davisae TaxID=3053515 RepID=UPI00257736E9|nr:cephalosporin hydroxylase family protein [Variovorax sp. J22P271]MDM0033300.1 cephalosporin hydroxylase family protein [Variovorax sp. J22P271]
MKFEDEVAARIAANKTNETLQADAKALMDSSIRAGYSYNFSWMGRPIIQYPQDIVALQEIIWRVQPDLIIETGIAHGGSLVFSAAMLELNAACGGPPDAHVLGIDIDIRAHNREAIDAHPMKRRIAMIEGSSIAQDVIEKVRGIAHQKRSVLVCLDSNHTHAHVLDELRAYAPLVTPGSYCVVFDTIVEDLPESLFPDRPWGPGDNPKTAVHEFLKTHSAAFEIDHGMDSKLLLSVAPHGYLKRVA